jgi:phage terminase large subunit-like protein
VKRSELLAPLRVLLSLPPEARRKLLSAFPREMVVALFEEWWWGAFGGQMEPPPLAGGLPWRVWTIKAGRGFGKTRAGAEWVWARARERGDARIALIGTSLEEVARVMVEGESGLLSIAREGEEAKWIASRGLIVFPSGAQAFAYTAERPGKLRGPQHHFAWCDELAHWPAATAHGKAKGEETWDNLMLGLRLGEAPRTVVTTTPKPVPLMKRVLGLERSVATDGRTDENPNNAADFRTAMRDMYAGTHLARQELDGELIEDMPGAFWTRGMLEAVRASGEAAAMRRVVVGVDPPASSGGDACGIVVCGLGEDERLHVLADLSAGGLRPEGWASRVAAAAEAWGAARVVAEKNQGGEMVDAVLRAADAGLPVRLVSATRSKAARAEPVALRFERGLARLAGRFPELEDQLCGLTYAGFEGPGSPDRADAMVWAMTDLMRPEAAAPRVRGL